MVWIPKSLIFDLSPPQGVTAFSLSHAAALGAGFFVAPQVHGTPPLLFYHSERKAPGVLFYHSGSGWPISQWHEAHHSGTSCPVFHLSGMKHPLFSLHHNVTRFRFTAAARPSIFCLTRSVGRPSISPHHRGVPTLLFHPCARSLQQRGPGRPIILFHHSGVGRQLFCFSTAAHGVCSFGSPQRSGVPAFLFVKSSAGR